ncbi:MAG: O-antigen ligase family protein [Pseudomonadota bacterium]
MTRFSYLNLVEGAVALILLLYPALTIAIKGGMNGSLIFILILCFMVWVKPPRGLSHAEWEKEWSIYAWAMASFWLAIVINQLYHQNFTAPEYDAPARYWLSIPVFLLLVRLRLRFLSTIQIAFPSAAIIGYLLSYPVDTFKVGIGTMDTIHFGDFELILGVMSIMSLHWFGRDKLAMQVLKIVGFIAGITASIATGTRGAWIVWPVFVLMWIYFGKRKYSKLRIAMTMVGVTICGIVLFFSSETVSSRVNELIIDVSNYEAGSANSSSGIRWQLYKASAEIFLQYPIFGAGLEGYSHTLQRLHESGEISQMAANIGRGEVHNELLAAAAKMGVFGLIAASAIYFVPIMLFNRAAKSYQRIVRQAGYMGLTFVVGFLVFGLTANVLNLTMATAFYSYTVAVLLAVCYNVHYETKNTQFDVPPMKDMNA